MRKYYLLCAVAIIVCSCKNGKDAKNQEDYSTSGDTICILQQSQLQKKIEIETARLLPYNETFTASGVVKAVPNNYAKIASPFAGRITKSYVRLGQKVKVGSPLFEISSEAFFDAVKDYSQARQELRAAYINMKRERDLVSNKVGAKKEEEDAELNYAMKKKELENAKSALSVYHISAGQMTKLRPLVVRSPIAGEVVSTDIVIGQYLKEDADPIATVANLDKVWVVAHVKEKDISLIRNLLKVNIELISLPGKKIIGKIYHIGEMMDEDTHSVEVIVECDNAARLMKPGMYGAVKLFDRPVQRIVIPSSAVLQEENSTYVFVSVGKNKYLKQPVQTISTDGGKAVITAGLKPGDTIITQGAFYLNNIL